MLAAAAALPAVAQRQRAGEYEVKAAFLFHFTQFVEWPAEAFASPDAPFAACVVGDDPFGEALDEVLRGEAVGHRPVVVRRHASAADARGCQLVFLSADVAPTGPGSLPGVHEGLVLAVADGPDQLTHGALLGFVLREGKVRLRVNATALRQTRLRVSSKLLRLAEQVRPASAP